MALVMRHKSMQDMKIIAKALGASFSSGGDRGKKGFVPSRKINPHYRPPQPIKSKRPKLPAHEYDLNNQYEDVPLPAYDEDLSLEERFGPATAAVIKAAIQEEKQPMEIEDHLRLADYMSSEDGTTEDLVGERQILAMEYPDPSDRKDFLKDLDDIIEEERKKSLELGMDDVVPDPNSKPRSSDNGSVNREEPIIPGKWATLIVAEDRVQKVRTAGRQMSVRVLVVGGNGNGCAGFGIGKAAETSDAILLAARETQRNIFFVDRFLGRGLSTDLIGKHNSCKVTLRASPIGSGSTGNELMQEICNMFGIADVACKSYGNRNPYNVVRATFKALMTHESMRDIALKRGKKLVNLERAHRLRI
eukprot:CAMPEP_0118673428 /NCGR_PEP_ID=MMETSP0800-20121206/313_1 /TAXON_ID=210618 ORGANISM="Striatella unipunctata, Strain CCMP2910" /NCGR_SAMPLE_ID=MMETSP0800 /ASSEMBLY_ACC=CAM_ASM_000638 /LENGTH=360 /DNA_ID=CAMNT_0006568483 /DNA_START=114 /DNA_END=1196 /DNA_ORIENTATION=+